MKVTNHQEKKRNVTLLYSASKPERGTAFEIYTDGTFIINRKITITKIHIPAKMQNWIDIEKSSRENKNSINITIITNDGNQDIEIISNQVATLERKDKQCFLKFRDKNVMNNKFAQYRDSSISCIISGLLPAELFYKNKEMLEQSNIDELNKKRLFGNKRRGSSYTIYQTTKKQLIIESNCWIGKSGGIELSQELWRYVKGWWNLKVGYVVGSINEGLKTIMRFSKRKKDKRLVRKITVPYFGARKRVKIVFTHPVFELSDNAKQNLTLVKELQQNGYNIKQLTSDWTERSRHPDKEFESKVWTVLERAFVKEENRIFQEVRITTSNSTKITKRIDGLLVCEELLGLIEIKTSEDIKNYELDEVIGELLLLQENISKNKIVTILFINNEVTTSEQAKIITRIYGSANNVLLIGKKEVETLAENPKLLETRLNELFQIQNKKEDQVIHPVTHTLTTKKSVEDEAYELLEQLKVKPNEANSIIEHYCFLMNVLKANFLLRYNTLIKQQKEEDSRTIKFPSQQIRPTTRFFDLHILKLLHKELTLNDNYSLIKERSQKEKHKKDYEVLLEQWTTIMKVLPPMVRVIQLKPFYYKKGVFHEQQTRQELEQEGFTVISNVLVSQYGKHFEIDHLAIKNKKAILVSCKDRSNFQELSNLYSKIQFAYGWLFMYSKALNNVKGKLFIRVKEEYLEVLQERYKDYSSRANSLIITH
ncbi:MAG TPA: nuclease-related domain-containing protein [candidate division Zixibacteria bacterium]|nr:nuclease-related domain-containing protein [candidate division Zixibacteria bacterium]